MFDKIQMILMMKMSISYKRIFQLNNSSSSDAFNYWAALLSFCVGKKKKKVKLKFIFAYSARTNK